MFEFLTWATQKYVYCKHLLKLKRIKWTKLEHFVMKKIFHAAVKELVKMNNSHRFDTNYVFNLYC